LILALVVFNPGDLYYVGYKNNNNNNKTTIYIIIHFSRIDRDPAHLAHGFGQQVASLVLWFGLDDWGD